MITQTQATTAVQAATAQLKQNTTDIAALKAQIISLNVEKASINNQLAAVTSDKTNLTASLVTASAATDSAVAAKTAAEAQLAIAQAAITKAQADLATAQTANNVLLVKVAELQSELATNQAINASLEAALTELEAALGVTPDPIPVPDPGTGGTGSSGGGTGGTVTPPPPPPPPAPLGDEAAIEAALTDSSAAGLDKRLGPSAPAGLIFPDVWTRPNVPSTDLGWDGGQPPMFNISEGLTITVPPPPVTEPPTAKPWYDYGSTELNIAARDDQNLLVNPNNPAAANSDGGPGPQGVGNYRLRTEEHANGAVEFAPAEMWNAQGSSFPDVRVVAGHTASYGMGNKLGVCIQMARGRINRYDGGFALYDKSRGGQAYVGTVGTQTAWSPWSGLQLDDNFIPLCMCVSSQNEFLFVAGHDKSTGKGKMIILVNWGGPYNDNGVKSFPFDLHSSYPGLVQSGVIVGMKIIGSVDLPVRWPTSISIATSRAPNDRIEGLDGNAAYLSSWDLSTKSNRDVFLSKNGAWIASWGKIAVSSKEENRVVQLDATALFQGYRDQYFTTDEKYLAASPTGPVTGNFWELFNLGDAAAWPYMLPAWAPTVTRVIDTVSRPTVAWMLETDNGAFVIADESGMLHWFKDDGTTDGTLQLGANITSIKDDKYNGVRAGAMTVTSRYARTIYGIYKKQIDWVIQDSKLLDPVDAGTNDTHGLETRLVWVLDFAGKQVRQYRNALLKLQTQGGHVFGVGPTADADRLAALKAIEDGVEPLPPKLGLEGTGSKTLPGNPVSGSDSNVN